MKPHQHDLFAPRPPERSTLRDWIYLEIHGLRRMRLDEIRRHACAAGYAEEVSRGDLERELSALVRLYLVRRVRGALDVLEVCP